MSDPLPVRLSTMGMFIIDTFHFIDPSTGADLGNKGLLDQIGGGGCYFAIGARVFLPPSSIQMMIDRGSDWRPSDQAVLDKFDLPSRRSMWHYRTRPDGTTRAVNIYRGEQRGFDYLSPKIRLEPKDLIASSPAQPARLPEWIHLICSPERALETVSQIDQIVGEDRKEWPKLVYEPIPDSCVFENLQDCLKVLPRLAVFSPNHEEAAALLGLTQEWERLIERGESEEDIVDFIAMELAGGFADHLDGKGGPIICIRSGKWGSVAGTGELGFHHIPAWHTSTSDRRGRVDSSSERIKDVTGAGNAFLGGFSAYLVQTEGDNTIEPDFRIREAAMHGAVSASLVIEQLGLPKLEVRNGQEFWNGLTAEERLIDIRDRLAGS